MPDTEEVFGKEINDPNLRIAKYIKGHRLKSGLSQLDVFKKTKIKQSNLSAFENGRRAVPKAVAKKLSSLYKCSYEIIIGVK